MDPMEARVHKCIGYLQTENFDRRELMDRLMVEVHLSPSRLSHLFRAEMGISLKKYLVWSRLKRTLQFVLKERHNLYAASLRAGFYDQAHLSRAFKDMLGLPPSAVYNSRTVQDF